MAPPEEAPPLLRRRRGAATCGQTLGNIVVSVVGTGVLGLPYAFSLAGWLAGSLGVAAAGCLTFYCMLLLVDCSDKLNEHETIESEHCLSYGELGERTYGTFGRLFTELLIVVSQAGGAVAYLVFIGQNLSSVFNINGLSLQPYVFMFALLLPLEVALSFVTTLSSLAPFSIFADACNVVAMAIVVKEDLQLLDDPISHRSYFNGVWALPFVVGVSIFCFEGFGMTLSLEASMAERKYFRSVLCFAFISITLIYICFGVFGYLAYGDETRDIITLNLSASWSSIAVKVGLCIALAFTFPIMMHPIHEIMEGKLRSYGWFRKLDAHHAKWLVVHLSRVLAVGLLAVVASLVPGFGSFISMVGSTVCALLSFVLPSLFHLSIAGASVGLWKRTIDYSIFMLGTAFAAYGVYHALAA